MARSDRLECDVTWTVRADALRTFGEFGLGSQNSYTVWEAQGGHIGYYIHVPFSRLNGKLSGTTTEICEGAPQRRGGRLCLCVSPCQPGQDRSVALFPHQLLLVCVLPGGNKWR